MNHTDNMEQVSALQICDGFGSKCSKGIFVVVTCFAQLILQDHKVSQPVCQSDSQSLCLCMSPWLPGSLSLCLWVSDSLIVWRSLPQIVSVRFCPVLFVCVDSAPSLSCSLSSLLITSLHSRLAYLQTYILSFETVVYECVCMPVRRLYVFC